MEPRVEHEHKSHIPLLLSGIAFVLALMVLIYTVYQAVVEPKAPDSANIVYTPKKTTKAITPTAQPTLTIKQDIQKLMDNLDTPASVEAAPEIE